MTEQTARTHDFEAAGVDEASTTLDTAASVQAGDWYHQFQGPEYREEAHGIATDHTGVYIVGCRNGTLSGESSTGGMSAFIRKYDKSGNIL